ncbi:hypothetical protein HD554DRAFT_2041290 [Boletus coccyginus]|nr:hypothetical protein HD554DRAFT_2041290 [Boletus coccyginus]
MSLEDDFVWGELNPSLASLILTRNGSVALIQANTACNRHYKSIGPLDDMPNKENGYDEDGKDEDEDSWWLHGCRAWLDITLVIMLKGNMGVFMYMFGITDNEI